MSAFSPLSPAVETRDASQPTKPLPRPSRRRDKPQLSCTLCRKRKLKCDRCQPCETCARRGLSLSCTYVHSNASERLDRSELPLAPSASIQDRIGQLERLVISLMNLNAAKPTDQIPANAHGSSKLSSPVTENGVNGNALPQDPSQLSDSFGRISLENSETSYVESAHWTAILDGIAELKDYFEDDHDPIELHALATEGFDGPELLCGRYKRVDKPEILAAIPSRSIVDRLIAKYFSTMGLVCVLTHRPTFIKEYEQFWNHPLDTSVMWIGLLFAIMCLGAQYQLFSSNESGQPLDLQSASDSERLIQTYREKTIQCLVLGKYTRSVPYTIETLLLYLHIEYLRSEDTQIGNWILMGIIVRLALRMGYHRDGSHSSRISPFHAEMRRRAWAVISQLDIFGSAQVGLPRMIKELQSDTAEPRNLLDEDFDENAVELPPPRPDTDPTPIKYLVAKNKLVSVFGMISDLTTSTRPPLYTEVMRLDRILHDVYRTMPHGLHMRPMTKSNMDSPDVIIGRIYVALLFHKSQCVLHWKYLLPARTDSSYAYSRTTCIEAALHILQYQWILNQETQSRGRLYRDRWKVSSIIKHDFLLATTILCLDLDHDITAELSSESQKNIPDADTRERVIQALNGSYLIWLQSTDSSRESQKAAAVLRIVLGKAQKMSTRRAADLGRMVSIMPAASSDSITLSNDSSSLMASDPIPQGHSATDSIGASAVPMDVSNSLPVDGDTLTDSSEIAADPFDSENWDSGYWTQSIEDVLEMSQICQGVFDFPI
ncbi:fungal-specific transcription factor domain-containing protein [Lipomyces tetrasporus]